MNIDYPDDFKLASMLKLTDYLRKTYRRYLYE